MVVMSEKGVTVHNVRFYKSEVRAIHCMCLEKQSHQLAVSRSDSSVEVWNVAHSPYLQRFIPGQPNSSVEDLKWCGTRLFSCGLQGTVVEYDLLNAQIKSSTSVTGGVAWCLDYSPKNNLVVVGTEDGFLNVLTLTEEGLEHLKFLDKQQGRVLCMCWDATGQYLVTGSVDVVRVWSLASGHAVHKMTTGRSQSHRETVVWSVAVTSDFTIVSGDSRGVLTFWDGKLGTQIESFRSHEADILSVALTVDETGVVCAGVDPVVAVYGRVVHRGGKRQWARGGLYRLHEHDVRAIALGCDGRAYSGGVSGYLVVIGTTPKVRLKCPPFLKGPCVQAVPELKQVLLRYLDRVELWRLGAGMAGAEGADEPLLLAAKPTCLLRLSAKLGESVLCAGVSPNGRYVLYSTQTALHVFTFNLEDQSLSKLPSPSECGPWSLLAPYAQGARQRCMAVTTGNEVFALDLTDHGVDEAHSFRPAAVSCVRDSIGHVAVSGCGTLLALGDASSHIAVWSTSTWTVLTSLPTYSAVPTALAFARDSETLFAAYSDHNFVEFELKEQKYSEFSRRAGYLAGDGVFHNAITGILFDPRRKDAALLHDDSALVALLTNKPGDKVISAKKQRKRDTSQPPDSQRKVNVLKKFRHILAAAWLEKDEVVVVELTPLALSECLPPALLKKKFGT